MPWYSVCLIILDTWKGFEYGSDIKYAKVMSRYNYNSIITIVTNVIMLVFLSARFVHPSAPQLSINTS